MHKAVLLQWGATLLAAIVAGVFFGGRGAVSAMCGGLAYALPCGFFAWRLRLSTLYGRRATVTIFVAGELAKLASTAGLIVLTAVLYQHVHWGALLIGLVLALKANLFAFLVRT